MKVTIPNTKRLSDDIWISEVSDSELHLIPGRPAENGGKNIVVISNPEFNLDGNLSFALREARLVNRAANQPTIFLEQAEPAVQQKGISVSGGASIQPSRIFWVTVASQASGNLQLGVTARVWGVKSAFRGHLDGVSQGDFVVFYGRETGFTLCRIESDPFFSDIPVWPDGIYPHRVKISAPLLVEPKKGYYDVSDCLLDAHGQKFTSIAAANRAISSHGGTFRRLSVSEAQQIFARLGWRYEVTTTSNHESTQA